MSTPPVNSPTPEQLARLAQAGCPHSFESLVRHFQVPLLHFLRRQTQDAGDAEDLLQETFLRCHRSLKRYDPGRSFGTWLFTIAYRLTVAHHRSRNLRRKPLEWATGTLPETPDGIASRREERQILWDTARRHLSADQFTSLWFHYAHDMPVAEIARIMKRTQANVKILLFRGRQKLRTLLESQSDSTLRAEAVHDR